MSCCCVIRVIKGKLYEDTKKMWLKGHFYEKCTSNKSSGYADMETEMRQVVLL